MHKSANVFSSSWLGHRQISPSLSYLRDRTVIRHIPPPVFVSCFARLQMPAVCPECAQCGCSAMRSLCLFPADRIRHLLFTVTSFYDVLILFLAFKECTFGDDSSFVVMSLSRYLGMSVSLLCPIVSYCFLFRTNPDGRPTVNRRSTDSQS